MPADIQETLDRLARLQEETTDANAKKELLAVIRLLRSFLQDQEVERNRLLGSLSQHMETVAELRTAAARAQAGGDQAPAPDDPASQAKSGTADTTATTAGRTVTPFELATSFRGVIDAIQTEARQSSGVATVIKSMDIEVKGLVQVEADRGTILVLPTIDAPIDSNSLSTLRISFGAIPVAAPANPVPTTVTVPDVRNKRLGDAISDIQKLSLAVGTVTEQAAPAVAGTVLSQQPAAGTVVAVQTPINLVVAATPTKIVVPNVVGLTLAGATNAIIAAGLQIGVVNRQQSTATADTVLQQNPSAASQVAPGTRVNLVVAMALATVAVPNVGGLTLIAATNAIKTAGLQIGVVDRQQSSARPETVLQQNPPAGQQVSLGTAVNLLLAAAPANVVVPNLVGLKLSRATEAIQTAGLQVGSIDRPPSVEAPDTVLHQSPGAGLSVPPGTPVNLVVASAPASVLVPNVVGLKLSAAIDTIKAAGLQVGVVSRQPNVPPDNRPGPIDREPVPPDTVLVQSPAAGERVPPGTLVALLVSAAEEPVIAPVLVPDLIGLTLAKATKRINAAGLTIGQVQKRPSAGPPGSVLQQNPTAGAKATLAATVDIVIDDR